ILPGREEERAVDAFESAVASAATVTPAELTGLAAEELLPKLFAGSEIRLFKAHAVTHDCRCTPERLAGVVRMLGEEELKSLLAALESMRVSGYDERPYKALSTAPEVVISELSMFNVVTHVDVIPNPQAAGLLTRLAEASRKEPGNLRFDVVQHAMRANHFTVIERWRNQAALDAHVAAAHTRQYRDEIGPLTGSPLDERVYVSIY